MVIDGCTTDDVVTVNAPLVSSNTTASLFVKSLVVPSNDSFQFLAPASTAVLHVPLTSPVQVNFDTGPRFAPSAGVRARL